MTNPSFPAAFLNLDMELDSPEGLQPLVEYLGRQVMVLHCGPGPRGEHLCVEPIIAGRLNADPVACTEHMLRLLEGLPLALKPLWQGCTSRVFDYGFEGGLEEGPMSAQLSVEQLERMVRLDVALRVTVYPFRAPEAGTGPSA